MSDRAANEKCAQQNLEQWREDLLTDANTFDEEKVLHNMHCMAHALLGFHSYTVKHLAALQSTIEEPLGRDKDAFLKRWSRQSDVVVVRVVRMAAEILGPMGDQKSGVMDKWQAYLAEHNSKSYIGSYRDN